MVDHAVERREVDISCTQSPIVCLQLNGSLAWRAGRCHVVGCLPQQALSIIGNGVKTFWGLNTGMERVFHRRWWDDGQRTALGSLQVVHPAGRSRERDLSGCKSGCQEPWRLRNFHSWSCCRQYLNETLSNLIQGVSGSSRGHLLSALLASSILIFRKCQSERCEQPHLSLFIVLSQIRTV